MKTKPEDALRMMISGPPASGKRTQSKLINKKYGLVHIVAGDLLRTEIEAGSEDGKRAKELWTKGSWPLMKWLSGSLRIFWSRWWLDEVVIDPIAGKIYHLKYSPQKLKIFADRLTQRSDDTEENVNGYVLEEEVFAQIDIAASGLLEQKARHMVYDS